MVTGHWGPCATASPIAIAATMSLITALTDTGQPVHDNAPGLGAALQQPQQAREANASHAAWDRAAEEIERTDATLAHLDRMRERVSARREARELLGPNSHHMYSTASAGTSSADASSQATRAPYGASF